MINLFKRGPDIEKSLLAVIILFSIYYFILAWFNTLAHDDQQFLYLFNTYGFAGSIKYYYLSWQGRVSAYVFTNLTLMADRYVNGLFVWFLFLVLFFVSSIYFFAKNILARFSIKSDALQLIIFSAYLFVFFQEIVYDKSTIYWLAASTSYYSGLAFLIAGTALIFSEGSTLWKFILLFIFFLIVGSSLENLAFISFFILFLFLFSAYLFNASDFFNYVKPKTVISLIALGAGITIVMLCPGLEHRRAGFPKPDIVSVIKITANSFYHYYKFMLLPDLGRIILFSSPFIYLGHKLRENDQVSEKNFFLKATLIILLFLIVLVFLNFLIMAKGTGGMGQPRTLFHIAFFIASAFSVIGFVSGYTSQVSRQFAVLLSLGAVVVFLISVSQNFFRNLPESIKYSKSEKGRIEVLLKEKEGGRTEVMLLDSLHYNQYVIYRSDEISADTTGEWNQTLKRAMGINFNVCALTANYQKE